LFCIRFFLFLLYRSSLPTLAYLIECLALAFSSQSDVLLSTCEPMNFSNVVALGQSLVPFFTDRDYPSLAFLLPTIGLLLKLESNERSEKQESNTASSLEWALYSPTNTIPQLQHATSTI